MSPNVVMFNTIFVLIAFYTSYDLWRFLVSIIFFNRASILKCQKQLHSNEIHLSETVTVRSYSLDVTCRTLAYIICLIAEKQHDLTIRRQPAFCSSTLRLRTFTRVAVIVR